MSKITFRADDELIDRLEEFDASKSEVMRDALREYLGEPPARPSEPSPSPDEEETLDSLITERVDSIIADRLDDAFTPRRPQDVNVNISLDGDQSRSASVQREQSAEESDASHTASNESSHAPQARKTEAEDDESGDTHERKTCTQCGETVSPSHVYCPNCGEKASHRVFCECGDELRSDWAFCPGCGRRTPAADVLDQP
ncbi:double zinc ribbon domain-containing protein [Halovenus marina]|jgi:hypothetical protein|uniref:double zinc ribbon domain-containing protein n=1 Tax=Halovenus marina TaxID=3396621 RepID=UPI003F56A4B4